MFWILVISYFAIGIVVMGIYAEHSDGSKEQTESAVSAGLLWPIAILFSLGLFIGGKIKMEDSK